MPKRAADLTLKMGASKKSVDYLSDDEVSDQSRENPVNIKVL